MTELPAKRTLRDILLDVSMANEEDPAFVKLQAEKSAKVDATCWYIDKLEAQIEKLQTDWIDVLLAKKAALQNAREKRLNYVKKSMELYGISLLKGDVRRIALQISPIALSFTKSADPDTWELHPGFVEVIPPSAPGYKWKRDAVLKAFKEGVELPFVEVTRGKHLVYKPRKKK